VHQDAYADGKKEGIDRNGYCEIIHAQILFNARHKTPAFSTMLLHQLHTVDGHASVHRFAHVINREQRHLHRG
jgi:hypothetical protein